MDAGIYKTTKYKNATPTTCVRELILFNIKRISKFDFPYFVPLLQIIQLCSLLAKYIEFQ